MKTIKVTKPLWNRYGGQNQPQPVYVEIDPEGETLRMDWNAEIGNAVPADVWHGVRLRYSLPDVPTIAAANRILDDVRPLAERIIAGHEVVWNGSNHVGRLDEDAQGAEDELQQYLGDCMDPDDCQLVWDESSLYDTIAQVTADMTDEEIEALARDTEDEIDGIIDFDLEGELFARRAHLIDERE